MRLAEVSQPEVGEKSAELQSEDMAEGKNSILIGMSQWSSNDLAEQMGTLGRLEGHQGDGSTPCTSSALQEKQRVLSVALRDRSLILPGTGDWCSGRVCLIGDCVGGLLAFDAICYSAGPSGDSPGGSSRKGSISSTQDAPVVADEACGLAGSKRLSKSSIDVSGVPDEDASEPQRPLPRKQSDSSTYDCEAIGQHHAFLSSIHSNVLKDEAEPPAAGGLPPPEVSLGRLDFDVSDFFLFGSPLGLVLAMRRTVLPGLDGFQMRPACSQVYSFFHCADPSASRLEPLLEPKFHLVPPVSVPRYQRFPLGDGQSLLLAEFTVLAKVFQRLPTLRPPMTSRPLLPRDLGLTLCTPASCMPAALRTSEALFYLSAFARSVGVCQANSYS
ncbi:membrane-associated phosphatidylinositol transfer protein 3 [Puma concolor]|uniref:Membrane-associated phosphatidylinositol transfer protein 3 n=1 Tax=Puma concolor TaxID=9696 RepID=A0A6P6HJU8_PUMCO|nr:membrane-associated phosphatidylinositol transfer protein 3 [Puma concolor]